MRTVAVGESATISGRVSTSWIRVQVEDSTGAMVDRSSFVKAIEYDQPKADGPIAQATITFSRQDGTGSTLAPLMTSNPPLEEGRTIALAIDAGAGVWKEQYRGRIEALDWSGRWQNEVVAECSDQSGELRDTFIETERTYGSDAGVAMETVMQSLYTDNAAMPPTLHVPVATSAVVTPAFTQPQAGLYEAARALSDAIGWVHWWRNFDASTSDWKLTLFEPARTSTTSQRTFGVSDYYDVSEMNTSLADIRNAVQVFYRDTDGVERKTAVLEDAASIAKYGRRYMAIIEGEGSPINTDALATTLGNAALSDLKEPTATLEIVAPYFWPGEIGVDRYTFTANGIHFSADQTLAATNIRHSLVVGQRPETRIQTRGQPTGGVNIWKAKAQRPKPGSRPETMLLQNFRARDSADGLSEIISWSNGAKIEEVWIAERTVEGQVTDADWTALAETVESQGLITSYTVAKPSEADGTARVTLVQIEGTYTDPATGHSVNADAWRRIIRPKVAIDAIDPDTGAIRDGALTDLTQFASTIRPPKIVSALPALPDANYPEGALVTLTPGDGTAKLYRNAGGTWTAAVPTSDLSGTITETQITDGAISTPKLAANAVTAVEIAAGTITANEIAANTLTAAQIAAGAIGVDELAANAVTAEKLAAVSIEVGKYIESSNYVAGSAGWRIDGSGNLEANDGTFRGQVASDTFTAATANFDGNVWIDGDARFTEGGAMVFQTTTPSLIRHGSISGTDGTLNIAGDTGGVSIADAVNQKVGFRGSTPVAKPDVSGSRGGNAALASLLTALATQGLITDSTT